MFDIKKNVSCLVSYRSQFCCYCQENKRNDNFSLNLGILDLQ